MCKIQSPRVLGAAIAILTIFSSNSQNAIGQQLPTQATLAQKSGFPVYGIGGSGSLNWPQFAAEKQALFNCNSKLIELSLECSNAGGEPIESP